MENNESGEIPSEKTSPKLNVGSGQSKSTSSEPKSFSQDSGGAQTGKDDHLLSSESPDVGKPYVPVETLDIVDGIRPSSSKTRGLALLPAIEESVDEDNIELREYPDSISSASSTSLPASPNLLARHVSVHRVSSKPTLTSISEELIFKPTDNIEKPQTVHYADSRTLSDRGGSDSGKSKRKRTKTRSSKSLPTQSHGDTISSDSFSTDQPMHVLEPSVDAATSTDRRLGVPSFPGSAGGEGLIGDGRKTETAQVHTADSRVHVSPPKNARSTTSRPNIANTSPENEETKDTPNTFSRRESQEDDTDGFLQFQSESIKITTDTDDISNSNPWSDSLDFLKDSENYKDQGNSAEEASRSDEVSKQEDATKSDDFSRSDVIAFDENSEKDLFAPICATTTPHPSPVSEDAQLASSASSQEVTLPSEWVAGCGDDSDLPAETAYCCLGEEQVVPLSEVLRTVRTSVVSDPTVYKPAAYFASLNIYVNQIVLGSLCEVIVQLALKKAAQDVDKLKRTRGESDGNPEASNRERDPKPSPSSSRPKGSGSDSMVTDVGFGNVDTSTPRESHSDHTAGSTSSEKQDKDFKDKEANKQRDKDAVCKQRGRERERNKRKRDREERGRSAGKKSLRNAVGDVHRSEVDAEDEHSHPETHRRDVKPTGKLKYFSTMVKDEYPGEHEPQSFGGMREETAGSVNRSDDSGDVLESTLKTSCALEYQMVTAVSEDSFPGNTHPNRGRIRKCDSVSSQNEDDKTADDGQGNVDTSNKLSASRFGKRTSLHRQKQNNTASAHYGTESKQGGDDISNGINDGGNVGVAPQNAGDHQEVRHSALGQHPGLTDVHDEQMAYFEATNHSEINTTDAMHQNSPHVFYHEQPQPVWSKGPDSLVSLSCSVYDESFNHPPKYPAENVPTAYSEEFAGGLEIVSKMRTDESREIEPNELEIKMSADEEVEETSEGKTSEHGGHTSLGQKLEDSNLKNDQALAEAMTNCTEATEPLLGNSDQNEDGVLPDNGDCQITGDSESVQQNEVEGILVSSVKPDSPHDEHIPSPGSPFTSLRNSINSGKEGMLRLRKSNGADEISFNICPSQREAEGDENQTEWGILDKEGTETGVNVVTDNENIAVLANSAKQIEDDGNPEKRGNQVEATKEDVDRSNDFIFSVEKEEVTAAAIHYEYISRYEDQEIPSETITNQDVPPYENVRISPNSRKEKEFDPRLSSESDSLLVEMNESKESAEVFDNADEEITMPGISPTQTTEHEKQGDPANVIRTMNYSDENATYYHSYQNVEPLAETFSLEQIQTQPALGISMKLEYRDVVNITDTKNCVDQHATEMSAPPDYRTYRNETPLVETENYPLTESRADALSPEKRETQPVPEYGNTTDGKDTAKYAEVDATEMFAPCNDQRDKLIAETDSYPMKKTSVKASSFEHLQTPSVPGDIKPQHGDTADVTDVTEHDGEDASEMFGPCVKSDSQTFQNETPLTQADNYRSIETSVGALSPEELQTHPVPDDGIRQEHEDTANVMDIVNYAYGDGTEKFASSCESDYHSYQTENPLTETYKYPLEETCVDEFSSEQLQAQPVPNDGDEQAHLEDASVIDNVNYTDGDATKKFATQCESGYHSYQTEELLTETEKYLIEETTVDTSSPACLQTQPVPDYTMKPQHGDTVTVIDTMKYVGEGTTEVFASNESDYHSYQKINGILAQVNNSPVPEIEMDTFSTDLPEKHRVQDASGEKERENAEKTETQRETQQTVASDQRVENQYIFGNNDYSEMKEDPEIQLNNTEPSPDAAKTDNACVVSTDSLSKNQADECRVQNPVANSTENQDNQPFHITFADKRNQREAAHFLNQIQPEEIVSQDENLSEDMNLQYENQPHDIRFQDENQIEEVHFQDGIRLENVSFQAEVQLEDVSFQEEIQLERVYFQDGLQPEGIYFQERVQPEAGHFQNGIRPEDLYFQEGIQPEDVHMQDGIQPEDVYFQKEIQVGNVNFQDGIQPEDVYFQEEVHFHDRIQPGDVYFQEGIQSEAVHFQDGIQSEVYFQEEMQLETVSFHDEGESEDVHLQKEIQPEAVHFQEGILPEGLLFQDADQTETVYFQDGLQPESVDFHERIQLEAIHFQDGIQLERFHSQDGLQPEVVHFQDGIQPEAIRFQGGIQPEAIRFQDGIQFEAVHFQGDNQPETVCIQDKIQSGADQFQDGIQSESVCFQKQIQPETVLFLNRDRPDAIHFQDEIPPEDDSFDGGIHPETLHFQEGIQLEEVHFQDEIQHEDIPLQKRVEPETVHVEDEIQPEEVHFQDEIQHEDIPLRMRVQSETVHFEDEIQPEGILLQDGLQPEAAPLHDGIQAEVVLPDVVQHEHIHVHGNSQPESFCFQDEIQPEAVHFQDGAQPEEVCHDGIQQDENQPGGVLLQDGIQPSAVFHVGIQLVEVQFQEEIQPESVRFPERIQPEDVSLQDGIQPEVIVRDGIKPGAATSQNGIQLEVTKFQDEIQPGVVCFPEGIQPGAVHFLERVHPEDVSLQDEIQPEVIVQPEALTSQSGIQVEVVKFQEVIQPEVALFLDETQSDSVCFQEGIQPEAFHFQDGIQPEDASLQDGIQSQVVHDGIQPEIVVHDGNQPIAVPLPDEMQPEAVQIHDGTQPQEVQFRNGTQPEAGLHDGTQPEAASLQDGIPPEEVQFQSGTQPQEVPLQYGIQPEVILHDGIQPEAPDLRDGIQPEIVFHGGTQPEAMLLQIDIQPEAVHVQDATQPGVVFRKGIEPTHVSLRDEIQPEVLLQDGNQSEEFNLQEGIQLEVIECQDGTQNGKVPFQDKIQPEIVLHGGIQPEVSPLQQEIQSEAVKFHDEIPSETFLDDGIQPKTAPLQDGIKLEGVQFQAEIQSEADRFKNGILLEAVHSQDEIYPEGVHFQEGVQPEAVHTQDGIQEVVHFQEDVSASKQLMTEKEKAECQGEESQIQSEADRFENEIPLEAVHFQEEIQSEVVHFQEEIQPEDVHFQEEIQPAIVHFREEIQPKVGHFQDGIQTEVVHFQDGIQSESHFQDEIYPEVVHFQEGVQPEAVHTQDGIQLEAAHFQDDVSASKQMMTEKENGGFQDGENQIIMLESNGSDDVYPQIVSSPQTEPRIMQDRKQSYIAKDTSLPQNVGVSETMPLDRVYDTIAKAEEKQKALEEGFNDEEPRSVEIQAFLENDVTCEQPAIDMNQVEIEVPDSKSREMFLGEPQQQTGVQIYGGENDMDNDELKVKLREIDVRELRLFEDGATLQTEMDRNLVQLVNSMDMEDGTYQEGRSHILEDAGEYDMKHSLETIQNEVKHLEMNSSEAVSVQSLQKGELFEYGQEPVSGNAKETHRFQDDLKPSEECNVIPAETDHLMVSDRPRGDQLFSTQREGEAVIETKLTVDEYIPLQEPEKVQTVVENISEDSKILDIQKEPEIYEAPLETEQNDQEERDTQKYSTNLKMEESDKAAVTPEILLLCQDSEFTEKNLDDYTIEAEVQEHELQHVEQTINSAESVPDESIQQTGLDNEHIQAELEITGADNMLDYLATEHNPGGDTYGTHEECIALDHPVTKNTLGPQHVIGSAVDEEKYAPSTISTAQAEVNIIQEQYEVDVHEKIQIHANAMTSTEILYNPITARQEQVLEVPESHEEHFNVGQPGAVDANPETTSGVDVDVDKLTYEMFSTRAQTDNPQAHLEQEVEYKDNQTEQTYEHKLSLTHTMGSRELEELQAVHPENEPPSNGAFESTDNVKDLANLHEDEARMSPSDPKSLSAQDSLLRDEEVGRRLEETDLISDISKHLSDDSMQHLDNIAVSQAIERVEYAQNYPQENDSGPFMRSQLHETGGEIEPLGKSEPESIWAKQHDHLHDLADDRIKQDTHDVEDDAATAEVPQEDTELDYKDNLSTAESDEGSIVEMALKPAFSSIPDPCQIIIDTFQKVPYTSRSPPNFAATEMVSDQLNLQNSDNEEKIRVSGAEVDNAISEKATDDIAPDTSKMCAELSLSSSYAVALEQQSQKPETSHNVVSESVSQNDQHLNAQENSGDTFDQWTNSETSNSEQIALLENDMQVPTVSEVDSYRPALKIKSDSVAHLDAADKVQSPGAEITRNISSDRKNTLEIEQESLKEQEKGQTSVILTQSGPGEFPADSSLQHKLKNSPTPCLDSFMRDEDLEVSAIISLAESEKERRQARMQMESGVSEVADVAAAETCGSEKIPDEQLSVHAEGFPWEDMYPNDPQVKRNFDHHLHAILLSATAPFTHRPPTPGIGDGRVTEKEESVISEERVDMHLGVATKQDNEVFRRETSPLQGEHRTEEDLVQIPRESKDGRRRVKTGAAKTLVKHESYTPVTKATRGAAVKTPVKHAPEKTRSADECGILRDDGDAEDEDDRHFLSLRPTRSSPAPSCTIRKIKLVDVEVFPKDVPSIYHPEPRDPAASESATNLRPGVRPHPMAATQTRREKKSTLWKRLRTMLKPPKLVRRDGKFKFVKKYKQNLDIQTSVLVEGAHHPLPISLEAVKSLHKETDSAEIPHSKPPEPGLRKDAFPATPDHVVTAWHRGDTPQRALVLRNKSAVKRHQWRRFRRLRVLRHSVERMGGRLPAVKRHAVSSKNYLRVNDPTPQGGTEGELPSAFTKPHRARSKRRSRRRRDFPLFEHPRDAEAMRRCEVTHAASPEVFEVFCSEDEDKELSASRVEPTVRLLMKPTPVQLSASVTSDTGGGSDIPVHSPTTRRPMQPLPGVLDSNAIIPRRPSSTRRWPCSLM